MPLYEGLGLISEKAAVIFDIGSAYTKCGFAGETGPRCIIPSEVQWEKSGKRRRLTEFTDKEDLYYMFVKFLHKLYFRHLLVNPKDRRALVVESLVSSSAFRDTLAGVLFRHYEVSSVLFVPSHLMALFTLGIPSALVLDVGYEETILIPVYEGIPVLSAWQALPVASKAIHRRLKEKLEAEGKIIGVDDEASRNVPDLTPAQVEDITVRTCFVRKASRPGPPMGVEYPLKGQKILHVPGELRDDVAEVLFEQDSDCMSVATLILDAIVKCPIDMRRTLAENLVVVGGTASLPGFKHRLLAEVRRLLSSPAYSSKLKITDIKLHRPPARDNYVMWLGGAIFGATDAIITRSLPRDEYLKNKVLPDWCNLNYNCQEDERVI